MGAINHNRIQKEHQEYLKSLDELTNNVASILTDRFTAITNTANSIFMSNWYKHYRNICGIYNSEFNTLKRMEISEDLRIKTISMGFISDLLVVTPSLDSVICKNGWFSIKDYTDFYGHISINTGAASNEPVIKSVNENYCTLVLNDINPRTDISVVCILIDKALFAKYFKQIQNDLMVYVDIKMNDQLLYQYGKNIDDGYSLTIRSNLCPYLYLNITYPYYNKTLIYENLYKSYIQLILVILASIIIAIVLAIINIRPLNALLKRFSGAKCNSPNDAYKYINDFVDNISYINLQLQNENKNLSASISKFFTLMQNEIMFSMLTNPEFDFNDEYIRDKIPWINDNLPFIMALIEAKLLRYDECIINKLSLPEEYYTHFSTFKILDNEYCMIFWFDDPGFAKKQREIIRSGLLKALGDEYVVEISDIMYKPHEMQDSFKLLKHNIIMQKQLSFELPITLQIDLITKIKNCQYEECFQLINQSKNKFKPESFLVLLLRIAHEYEIDAKNTLELYERHMNDKNHTKLWNLIVSFTSDIITTINISKSNKSKEIVKLIREFIDLNYNNPNMSIKLLSSVFKLDGTLISKVFKEEMGMTFSEYLLKQRMKLALQLLKNSEMSLTDISEAVGYTHYLSFKRAFTRFKGVTPKEYRELNYTI